MCKLSGFGVWEVTGSWLYVASEWRRLLRA